MLRRACLLAALVAGLPGGTAAADTGLIEVIEVSGLIDERLVEFTLDAIAATDADAVVLQIDSRGSVTEEAERLVALLEDPPLPIVVWVGPDPARAYGAAAHLVAAAPLSAAAPGAKIGFASWFVSGGAAAAPPEALETVADTVLTVGAAAPGPVDLVVPSIGQLVVGLDGRTVAGTLLSTAQMVVGTDGLERPEPTVETRFHEPGLWTRTLRLGATPEAAFMFVVIGLALAAFEFYAAGVGLMAAVAVVALVLGGYGVAVLPVRPWAVALVLIGVLAYVADFQRNDLGWRSIAGTGALVAAGVWFVDADPHFATAWWTVALVVAGAALFFGIGMTAVVRARFSSSTIGREALVGRTGTVTEALEPEGIVDVGGAAWRARGPRSAESPPGARVVVTGIEGVVLQVEPAAGAGTAVPETGPDGAKNP